MLIRLSEIWAELDPQMICTLFEMCGIVGRQLILHEHLNKIRVEEKIYNQFLVDAIKGVESSEETSDNKITTRKTIRINKSQIKSNTQY